MDTEAAPTHLADGDALEEFVDDHALALVEFYTEGCPKCRAMEPVLGNVARASEVAVGLLNPGDDLALVERFDVRSVPTLVLFADGEAVATTAEGFQGTEAVLEFVRTESPGPVGTR